QLFDIVSKLIEKRFNSLETDNVIDLLIEMDKQKFEKVFLIPKLNEIKGSVQGVTREEMYLNYLSTSFNFYGVNDELLDQEENERIEDCIFFIFSNEKRKYYTELIGYISRKYEKNFPSIKPPNEYKDYARIDIIEKYAEVDDDRINMGQFYVSFDKIPLHEDLLEDFIKQSRAFTIDFDFAMNLLEILEEKHKESDNILGEIFGINS
ncbi:MAG: hypothetical protein K6T88_06285, partial [Bacillus sp. (in: Bacteria)]|nr:hypothetical protein [Bacillus sp. (in: firmicutes)]